MRRNLPSGPRFWIGVASREHVRRGVEGGFCQLCHGKAAPLRRMGAGDWIAYYSPKESFGGAVPCQRFTGLGHVRPDPAYQVEMAPDFTPWRRNVDFAAAAREAPILPLVHDLAFIRDKRRWGYPFRFGHFTVSAEDFARIATAMWPAWGERLEV